MNNEPVAIRYDFDGYGYQYMDSGSGSDWQTRVEGEFLYTHPAKTLTDEEYENLMKQWDYWRKQIADGDKSSAPRDWFECVIEHLLEQY